MSFFKRKVQDRPEKTEGQKQKKPFKRVAIEYAEAIVTALILALIIRAYVVQAFKIPSGSMLQTLQIGDHILVNKFIYGTDLPFSDKKVLTFKDPEKGDIIVFITPEDDGRDNPRDFIKRLIGVGGDTVMYRDKKLFVNGEPLEEPYAQWVDPEVRPLMPKCEGRPWEAQRSSDCRDNFGPFTVPEGKYFMMGDNRDQSHDSRFWGFVDREKIKGKALIIYWSWDGEKKFPRFGRIANLVR